MPSLVCKLLTICCICNNYKCGDLISDEVYSGIFILHHLWRI